MEKVLFTFSGYSPSQFIQILAYLKTEIDFIYHIINIIPSTINENERCYWIEIEVEKNNYDRLIKWCTFFAERNNILKQIF